MKKIKTILIISFITSCLSLLNNGCVTTEEIKEKDGALLWSENCNRCHNAPSPADYSDAQWEIIGTHMKVRANLTDEETKEIVEFLQSAN